MFDDVMFASAARRDGNYVRNLFSSHLIPHRLSFPFDEFIRDNQCHLANVYARLHLLSNT
jgi:hypothetical protein